MSTNTPSTINSQTSTNLPLIPLHDGRPGLRRGLHAEVREPILSPDGQSGSDGEGRGEGGTFPTLDSGLMTRDSSSPATPDTRHSSPILDFIASSEALDRYNEIISADGWRLENYRRNPVFQNAHQYGDIIFTLGKALITEVRAGKLFQRVEFATDINPMAKIAYGLYKGKFLNAVSVGFIPLKWEDGPAQSQPSTINSPSLNQQFRRKYISQELLEVSAVGIPANPEALQLGLKAGAVEKADIRALLDLVRLAYESRTNSPSDLPVRHQPSPRGEGESPSVGIAGRVSGSSRASQRFPLPGGEGQGERERSLAPTHSLTGSPLHTLCGNPAAPNIHARVSGVRSYEAQLLQLARALRDVLKGDRG